VADDEVGEVEIGLWKERSRQVAVNGYHLVLEYRPDLSDLSDDANLPVDEPNMYTERSSILDVRLTGFEAFLLRQQGMARRRDTVSRTGSKASTPAMFE
jgi:hypothetical protein